ncbi:MAG: hypothetical protein ACRDOO_26705 [Actinomadura sp.]
MPHDLHRRNFRHPHLPVGRLRARSAVTVHVTDPTVTVELGDDQHTYRLTIDQWTALSFPL